MLFLPYFLATAVVVTAIAAWFDWRTGHIPNAVTLGPLLVAPLAHFATMAIRVSTDEGVQAAGFSILGAATCALVPVVLYRAGAMGGGDVKLFAAMGALMRPLIGVEAQFYAFVATGIISLGILAWEGKLLRVLGNTLALAVNPFLPKDKRREVTPEMMTWVRFGPGICAGTIVATIVHWRQP